MNTNRLESKISEAIEDAIWECEWRDDEKVDNLSIEVHGKVVNGDLDLIVDIYELEDYEKHD